MSYTRDLLDIFKNEDIKTLILNINTEIISYDLGNEKIITTVTNEVGENSYVVSPYSLMIDYGEDELVKIDSKIIRKFYYLLIKSFASFLKFAEIDKVQTLNNYLFATNFFSKKWDNINIGSLREIAISTYPKHALIIRSVNKMQNPKVYQKLCKNGWKAIAVKQVYIYSDKRKWQICRNSKNDKKLSNSDKFSFEDASDYNRALELYNALYLDKHSKHNIHYSAKFLELLSKKGLLKLFFLRDNDTKKYVGIVGLTKEEDNMTVPVIGYDMSYSKKDALYRRLVYQATDYAFENNCLLNFSSGAPDFKLKRGAKAQLDYTFVYDKHLSFKRRLAWKVIYMLSRYLYAPMLKKLKL